MATPISPAKRDELRVLARQLAANGASHRAIGRDLGIHHNTVARLLAEDSEPDTATSEPPGAPDDEQRATPGAPDAQESATPGAPDSEPERATTAPPAPTSGDTRRATLSHPLPDWFTHDLNVLMTGHFPDDVARHIHHAAEARRAIWRAEDEADDAAASQERATAEEDSAT